MLVRCLAPPSLSGDCRPRLSLSSVPQRCNTNSTPAGLPRRRPRTGFSWKPRGRASSACDRSRLESAKFAFGRRRLLFGGWDDRVYRELSPPSRLLLRKRVPPLSVQRLNSRGGPNQVARFKALGRHCATCWNLPSQPETCKHARTGSIGYCLVNSPPPRKMAPTIR